MIQLFYKCYRGIIMKETKKEKFIRLAEKRTNKALEAIRLLGNLSNKNVYEYKQEEVEKIFNALDKEIEMAKSYFMSNNKNDKKFRL